MNSPHKVSVTRSFETFFDLRLNKQLSKQSWGWLFETQSRPLWRHSNGIPENMHTVHTLCIVLVRQRPILSNCITITPPWRRRLNTSYTELAILAWEKKEQQNHAPTNLLSKTHNSKNLNVSRLVLLLSLPNVLKPGREWRCIWISAHRRCSNYMWVINNFIAYQDTTYSEGLKVISYGICCKKISAMSTGMT